MPLAPLPLGSPMVSARRDSANHYRPPFRYHAVLMLPDYAWFPGQVLIKLRA
jgi:hypothetical protein